MDNLRLEMEEYQITLPQENEVTFFYAMKYQGVDYVVREMKEIHRIDKLRKENE